MPTNDPEGEVPDHGLRALNTNLVPLGERALRGILDHVNAVGDEAETAYLEVKSTLDLGSKLAIAKISKILLGVANRQPREAALHFHGYAVLVIGANKGSALGVPRGLEAHDLENRIRPYVGPELPAFEFGRIAVNAENEVLFLIAPPPEVGQTIFPCRKNFQGENRQDNLEDGAIYVRGISNTTSARYAEVLALVERARGGGKPPIDLKIDVLGPIGRVARVDDVLGTLHDYEEKKFSDEPQPTENAFSSTSVRLATSIFGGPGPLSVKDRERALNSWRSARSRRLREGREHLLGAGLPGAGLRVISQNRFIAKPHLIVTFHDCEVFDYINSEDADYGKVVEPILQTQNRFMPTLDYSAIRLSPRDYPVAWSNQGENAEVILTPESFRPNTSWTSDLDDYVLVARNTNAEKIEVSWVLTEDGNDAVARGSQSVPTLRPVDAADLFSELFQ